MRVRDFSPDSGTIHVRETKSGHARHVALNDDGKAIFASLATGKTGKELIFQRSDGGSWKAAQQTRPLVDACKRASISPAIGFHVLRHSYASATPQVLFVIGFPQVLLSAIDSNRAGLGRLKPI
jgi:site-specific recombinase XerD